jgi:hypothetical protein
MGQAPFLQLIQPDDQPLTHLSDQLPHSGLLIGGEFVDTRDMPARRDQRVSVSNRKEVCESNRVLVLDPFAVGIKRAEGAGRHRVLRYYLLAFASFSGTVVKRSRRV